VGVACREGSCRGEGLVGMGAVRHRQMCGLERRTGLLVLEVQCRGSLSRGSCGEQGFTAFALQMVAIVRVHPG